MPSVAGAIKAADAGVDGLVIEGTEGGGFKSPEEVGLIVLIQAIRKHTDFTKIDPMKITLRSSDILKQSVVDLKLIVALFVVTHRIEGSL